MESVYGVDAGILFGIIILFMLILLILLIILWAKLRGMKKKYTRMMNGVVSGSNMEELLVRVQDKLEELKNKTVQHDKELAWAASRLKKMQGNIGVLRYNAFNQQGSDLSFSIAFLNEQADGVVLSGIHNREDTYIYAKPVQKGSSEYPLTPEEKQVINQTLRPQSPDERRQMEKAGGIV